jgi:hypothetical protein
MTKGLHYVSWRMDMFRTSRNLSQIADLHLRKSSQMHHGYTFENAYNLSDGLRQGLQTLTASLNHLLVPFGAGPFAVIAKLVTMEGSLTSSKAYSISRSNQSIVDTSGPLPATTQAWVFQSTGIAVSHQAAIRSSNQALTISPAHIARVGLLGPIHALEHAAEARVFQIMVQVVENLQSSYE